MSDETKLHVMAVLRRPVEGRTFTLAIRWLLGTGEALPRSDDAFLVNVKLLRSGRQIARDGTVVDGTPEHWIDVRPRNFAMIDPPRKGKELGQAPSGESYYQAVALKPTAPIDPAVAASGSLRDPQQLLNSYAVGVIHVLDETEPSREAWRLANVVAPALRDRFSALRAEGRSLQTFDLVAGGADPIDRSAKALARFFVSANVRPIDIPRVLTVATARFRALAQSRGFLVASDMPSVFALEDGAGLREHAEHAALVTSTLNDQTLLERLDNERRSRQQTRQQLRMRALQGGELLDFWCSPDTPAASCDDGARGKRYPAAILIGIGLQIDGIDPGTVRQWVDQGEVLSVSVRHDISGHQPRVEHPFLAGVVTTPGNLDPAGLQTEQFEQGTAPLLTAATEILRALNEGSSQPPPPPRSAEINYDLTQSNAGDTGSEPTVTFETGEGKVQFLILPPEFKEGEKTVYAFNLYGMWEDATTERFFRDPPEKPNLAELKPWRISSRYSYTRDLAGAFPTTGVPHKALQDALSDPPWFPILERPTRVYEPVPPIDPRSAGPDPDKPQTQPTEQPLPQVGRDGMTATSIDLRKGMSASFGTPPGVEVRWDPFGTLNIAWTPAKQRDNSAATGRPQRYRFWVTSVDPFEQESAPVPVFAHDEQAGEPKSLIYSPRFRTPIGAPPQRHGADGKPDEHALRLKFDPATDVLVTTWETPFAERIASGGQLSPTARIDKAWLRARVVLFRRRLMKPVESAPQRAAAVSSFVEDEPQWHATYLTMRERGFEEYHTFLDIAPPAAGDVWTHPYSLPWKDRGFEYVAAVSFRVRDELAPFWSANVTAASGPGGGRRVVLQELVNGAFEPRVRTINEVPRASDVALTDIEPVVNDVEPRGATASAAPTFKAALPVTSPARIRRDLILLRLLSHQIKGSADIPWPKPDSPTTLSPGRIAMCEAAIRRTLDQDGSNPDVVKAPRLDQLCRLLAGEFGKAGTAANASPAALPDSSMLAHHSTIGFRGIYTLAWRYEPFAAQTPADRSEAEAIAMRIYQVRAPMGRTDAVGYATFYGPAQSTVANTYRFDALSGGSAEAVDAIASLHQPAVARISTSADEAPQFRGVAAIDATDKSHPILTLLPAAPDAAALPAHPEIIVFGAQPLADVPVADFTQPTDFSLNLPVGGGTPEMFFWWVSSVSAQGREAGPQRRPMFRHFGPRTIEPEPPLELKVMPPTDRVRHELDPTNSLHRKFLPARINSADRAHNNPRLLLTWLEPEGSSIKDSNGLLVLYRQWQLVSQNEAESARLHAASLTLSPWQAVKNVEAVAAGDPIDPADLAALDGWLRGAVLTPDDESPIADKDLFIGPERNLDGATGLLRLQIPAANGTLVDRSAFIDYYFENRNNLLAMEGSRLYAYKAARAIDLDPENRFGLEPRSRYLHSRTTDWTPFRLPETPAFEIFCFPKTMETPIAPTLSPVVVFEFQTKPFAEQSLAMLEDPVQIREWKYRIIVRRMLSKGLSVGSGTPFEPRWIEVGQPLDLPSSDTPGSTVNNRIVDDGLDRDEPDRELLPLYQLSITQVAIIEDANGNEIGERPVRHGSDVPPDQREFTVRVPPMQMGESTGGPVALISEWKVTQKVAVV